MRMMLGFSAVWSVLSANRRRASVSGYINLGFDLMPREGRKARPIKFYCKLILRLVWGEKASQRFLSLAGFGEVLDRL